ncbi:hypothetical protein F5Y19DRAFT_480784 [Xylariaceae sp. FL1651]|nr:hypothetical protein F5Y19DRAFT_480784 [Xylariaceae sp. FL1651]
MATSQDQPPTTSDRVPTGRFPAGILSMQGATVRAEHQARGIPTENKLVKVMKMERIMFELRVPADLQQKMLTQLAAADMGDSNCKVKTLQEYLGAVGGPVIPGQTKAQYIEAIIRHWVGSTNLETMPPFSKEQYSSTDRSARPSTSGFPPANLEHASSNKADEYVGVDGSLPPVHTTPARLNEPETGRTLGSGGKQGAATLSTLPPTAATIPLNPIMDIVTDTAEIEQMGKWETTLKLYDSLLRTQRESSGNLGAQQTTNRGDFRHLIYRDDFRDFEVDRQPSGDFSNLSLRQTI